MAISLSRSLGILWVHMRKVNCTESRSPNPTTFSVNSGFPTPIYSMIAIFWTNLLFWHEIVQT